MRFRVRKSAHVLERLGLAMAGAASGLFVGVLVGSNDEIDTAEFLSAVGTFLATGSAFASVGAIVLRHDPHIAWTSMIMAGWLIGVTMQIIAGAIARLRRR